MKENKGRISFIAGLICLVMTLLFASVEALPYIGVSHPILIWVSSHLNDFFSFSVIPSPLSLLPVTLMLLVWTIMIFAFRKNQKFFLILIPVTALMAYTLYTLSHVMQGSTKPLFITSIPADLRSASFKIVLLFFAEMLLFVILTLIGDGLKRYQEKKIERALRKAQKNGQHEEIEKEEEHTVVLNKKPVPAEKVEEGKSFTEQQQVSFPPVAEVPSVERISKKRSTSFIPAESEVLAVKELQVGKMSIGALHTLGEERKRNNGMSYLERKQQEIEEQKRKEAEQPQKPVEEKKEHVQLSGFLQGALEAVGRAPKKTSSRRSEPQGKVKSMLAQAVEDQAGKQDAVVVETPPSKSLNIRERILSVQYEKEEPPKPTESIVEKPVVPQPAPIFEKPIVPQPVSPIVVEKAPEIPQFAPKSTAQPINGSQLVGEAVKAGEPEEEEADPLESASGVGGLAGKSASALINRARITYQYPSDDILVTYPQIGDVVDEKTVHQGQLLVSTLEQFNISVELTNIVRGPTVTMFELLPAPGVRVNSIVNLSDNIALALAATQVRIVAPIPGKSAVGVEIPNIKRDIIGFREMLPSLVDSFGIPMVLGRSLMGKPIVVDVIKAPHLLIAGSTGSGKSVCVNSLICSVLFRRSPKQVRMILVDPKIVELNIYNGIPHLLTPVITDAKKTLKALDFCLYEMDRRYKLLQAISVRNIIGYNEKIENSRLAREKLPYILVVIDEFADLMHLVGKDMETKVSRLAAMSRAVGIHLVLATQRPSVDVITGVIKNNIPSRIAFAVTSAMDSRIILDEPGADKLLGKGDMLFMSSSSPATERIQGSFLSDDEVEQVVRFVSSQGEPDYIDESFFEDDEPKASESSDDDSVDSNDDDELMDKALAIVVERKCASASYLQRRLKIGYNRAARLVEQMEEMGYVGPPNGSKPRELIKYP